MGKRIVPEEHVENFFRTASEDSVRVMLNKVAYGLQCRFPDGTPALPSINAPAKRGRKPKQKPVPPLTEVLTKLIGGE